MTDTPLPPAFYECIDLCKVLLEGTRESCCVDLATLIAQFVQLYATNEHTSFVDDELTTDGYLRQVLATAALFDDMEDQLMSAYPYLVNHSDDSEPRALFRGQWHTYNEIWGARIWNHFRWARILLNQILVEQADACPISASRCVSPAQRVRAYATIEKMAVDTMISTPSHWHHPVLHKSMARKYEASGQGSGGAVGLPSLLWHLTIASCAPNVPPDLWDWARDIMDVVWKDMGMQHALSLAEVMEQHRGRLAREVSEAQSSSSGSAPSIKQEDTSSPAGSTTMVIRSS